MTYDTMTLTKICFHISGQGAARLKAAYGEFCSRHRDAVDIYKDYLQHDRRFAEFIKHCQVRL